jgi:membrane fusion protein, multidrug efflux system
MRLHKAGGFFLAAGLAALACLAGCSRGKVESAPQPAPVPVRVAQVEKVNIPVVADEIGTGEAYSSVQVKPLVAGRITGLFFKEGDFVHQGQLLGTIDPEPFQVALDQAVGTLAKDKAQAEFNASNAERYQKLFQAGIVPRDQYEQLESQAVSSKAQVQADQAAVESAKLQLSYCKIYSPIDGKTGALQLWAGNLAKANDVSILVTINQVTPIYVDFSVPQDLLPQVREAMAQGRPRVLATLQADPQHPEIGYLDFIDNAVDATTGTIKLKGVFANEDHRLWPGQFVNVELQLAEQTGALVVPTQAVQTSQQGPYVWLVKQDGTAAMRPVKIGQQARGQTVISEGLEPGQTVVTDGELRLIPGSRVQIRSGL